MIGWFQGGSEFGPRALGNRSLLGDPRKPEMKDILNSRVKHRQAFRPFAPIVLAERMNEIFEGDQLFILAYDVFLAMRWPVNGMSGGVMAPGPRHLGIGVGTLMMVLNVILLSCYTFGCHSLRHLIGGNVDCYSCVRAGRTRFQVWRGVTVLNKHHMLWAWCSLFSVALTDVYIRLCAMGVIHDVRIF